MCLVLITALLWLPCSPACSAALPSSQASPGTQEDASTLQQLLKQANELLRQEKLEEAKTIYKKILAAKPDYAEAHYGLAAVYTGEQDAPQAVREYRTALKLKPSLPGVHMNLGALYESQGQLTEAIDEYRAEVRLQASSARAHTALGNALVAARHGRGTRPASRFAFVTVED